MPASVFAGRVVVTGKESTSWLHRGEKAGTPSFQLAEERASFYGKPFMLEVVLMEVERGKLLSIPSGMWGQ